MNKLEKFLKNLSKKEFKLFMNKIFPKIKKLQLSDLDVKPLTGYKGFYRVRVGNIRIIFIKDLKGKKGIIVAMDYRKDIYKNL